MNDTIQQAVDVIFNRYEDPRTERDQQTPRKHFRSDILISAILAGSIASLSTNGFEIL